MQAGEGIVHSERTSSERRERDHSMFGLQTWVALPKDQEESPPAFFHHDEDALPVLENRGRRVRLLAGDVFGKSSPLEAASATLYADVELEAGTELSIPSDYPERAIYTLGGRVELDGCTFESHRLVVLRPGTEIGVEALEDAHFMLFGGEPMEGPRYIWWNFVSSRRERIEQAKEEWARGAFDTVPGDEEEFIELPDDIGHPRQIDP